jgi:hypothetical protein
VLPGFATRVTPVGAPVAAVVLKPVSVVAAAPSKTLFPFG